MMLSFNNLVSSTPRRILGKIALAGSISALSACSSVMLQTPAAIPEPMPAPVVVEVSPPPAPAPAPAPAPTPVVVTPPSNSLNSAIQVTIYYATDRKYVGSSTYFDGQPNEVTPNISYGTVSVSLPTDRKIGEIPEPKWYEFFYRDDASKFTLINKVSRLGRDDFFGNIRQAMQSNSKRPAFIYIHGYNNSFEDAAKRTAQIAADINLPCLPVFYSWPSRATPQGYPTDEESAAWTQSHLQEFLADFADKSSADSIYVIAHSMGNRPTVNALANLLEKRPELKQRFTQLILAAPDINASIFRTDIAPRFVQLGTSVTVYASKNDKALQLSRDFHKWPRLGDMGGEAIGIEGIDLVDASKIETNFMGHDYTLSNRALLTDVQTLIRDGTRASKRSGLKGVPEKSPQYYAFP